MTWAVWLGVPAVATALAAVWTWLRSRPARTPSTVDAMKAHSDYLDALSANARGRQRVDQVTADTTADTTAEKSGGRPHGGWRTG